MSAHRREGRRGQAKTQRLISEIGRCDSDKLPVLVALTMSMITGQGGRSVPRRSNLDARDKFGRKYEYLRTGDGSLGDLSKSVSRSVGTEISRVFTLLDRPP